MTGSIYHNVFTHICHSVHGRACVDGGVCDGRGVHGWEPCVAGGACMAGGVSGWSHARPLYGWLVGGRRPIRMLNYSLLKVLLNVPQFVAISSQTILSAD